LAEHVGDSADISGEFGGIQKIGEKYYIIISDLL